MNLDRIERLISEFIEELENNDTGNYHLENAIDLLQSTLMELEKLELLPEYQDD